MSLTHAQMRNEVLDNISRAGAGVSRSGTPLSSLATRWLNRAQRVVARKYNLLYKVATASTVSGTQMYGFPGNLRSLHSMILESGSQSRKLKIKAHNTFYNVVPLPSNDATNIPEYYVPYKKTNEFQLYPIPDDTYTLRLHMSYWPTDLTTDAQTVDFHLMGIDIDDILIDLATAYGYKYLQEYSDFTTLHAHAMSELRSEYKAFRNFVPDWAPKHESFNSSIKMDSVEYYNDPFVTSNP